MRYLAWDPDDADRDSARRYADEAGPSSIARQHARWCYKQEPFENYIDVTVIEIDDDGTETRHEFTVDVEYEPKFSARSRT